MVLPKMSEHALFSSSSNFAGRWTCQRQFLCRPLWPFLLKYLEGYSENIFYIVSILDIIIGL
jgi:hypothetical protein